jgi:FADH2-dependent halogenase
MYSGKLAAQTVLECLRPGKLEMRRLRAYEAEVFRAMKYYWEMVEGFYTKPFIELFMEPKPKFNLPDAITAILAGELHGGWPMSWRRHFFFWLVWIQERWPLVPRVSFESNPEPTPGEKANAAESCVPK